MSDKYGFRYRQAHPAGERDWQPLIVLILMVIILLTVVVWGVPSGLPS